MRDWTIRVVAVLALAGLGGYLYHVATATPDASHQLSSIEQVRAMLRARAMSLTAGDVNGFLRPVTPGASDFEGTLARGSRAVPLVDVHMTALPGRFQDLNASSFKDMPVLFVYRYRDLPSDNQFEFQYLSTIERQGTSWVVTASKLKMYRPDDPNTLPPVWFTGPVQFDRSGHFLAIYRPGLPHEKEDVALAEQARTRLVPKVLIDFDDVHLMLLGADRSQYVQMVGDPKFATSSGVAKFIFSGDPVSGRKLPVNRHIILDGSLLFGPNAITPLHGEDRTPIQVVQHELGHLALFRYDTPDTPNWLNEGGAQYLSGEMRTATWRTDAATNTFPATIEGIETAWEKDKSMPLPGPDYPYANAAVLALVSAMGPQQWFDYYKGYQFVDVFAGGLTQAKEKPTEILLGRFYKFDRAQLDIVTRDYERKAVGAGSGP